MNWAFDDMLGQFYFYEHFNGRVKGTGICKKEKEKNYKREEKCKKATSV